MLVYDPLTAVLQLFLGFRRSKAPSRYRKNVRSRTISGGLGAVWGHLGRETAPHSDQNKSMPNKVVGLFLTFKNHLVRNKDIAIYAILGRPTIHWCEVRYWRRACSAFIRNSAITLWFWTPRIALASDCKLRSVHRLPCITRKSSAVNGSCAGNPEQKIMFY